MITRRQSLKTIADGLAAVAYATSVKSIPAVLASDRKHGLENHADFYSVIEAEAIQILSMAEDVLLNMAYGPLSITNPEQITDDPDAYKMKGGIRGLSTSLYRTTEWNQPVDATVEIIDSGDPELDGSLSDALEIIEKLATSERVEQVFVR